MLGFDAVRKIHVHIGFDCSLRICHSKIKLIDCPHEKDGKDDKKSNAKPCYHWSRSLKLIDTEIFFATMNIETCLVLGNIICGEIVLVLHGPD